MQKLPAGRKHGPASHGTKEQEPHFAGRRAQGSGLSSRTRGGWQQCFCTHDCSCRTAGPLVVPSAVARASLPSADEDSSTKVPRSSCAVRACDAMLARAKQAFDSPGPVWGLILAPGLPDYRTTRVCVLLLAHPPSIGACARAVDRSLQPGCSTSAHAIYTWPIRAGLGSPDKRNRRVSRLWRHSDKMLSASTCSANNFRPQPLTQPSRRALSGQWPPPSPSIWPAGPPFILPCRKMREAFPFPTAQLLPRYLRLWGLDEPEIFFGLIAFKPHP